MRLSSKQSIMSLLGLAVVLLAFQNCGQANKFGSESSSGTEDAKVTNPIKVDDAGLSGMRFRVTKLIAQSGCADVDVPAGTACTMIYGEKVPTSVHELSITADGKISLNLACNSGGGQIEIGEMEDPSVLQIRLKKLYVSERACAGLAEEALVLHRLAHARLLSVDVKGRYTLSTSQSSALELVAVSK